jgi:OOP family OmpA-OmpF porin
MLRRNLLVLMLGASALSGCADWGGPSRAELDYRDAVRTTEGQVVRSTNGACVRTQWMNDRDVCAPQTVTVKTQVQQRVESRAAQLTQEQRTVYFEFDRAELTPAARARLDTLADVLKADQTVREARVVGYADRMGTRSYNRRLSQARALAVKNYLVGRGYLNAQVVATRWLGEERPTAQCPRIKNREEMIACLAPDRKVEVEIIFNPREQGARPAPQGQSMQQQRMPTRWQQPPGGQSMQGDMPMHGQPVQVQPMPEQLQPSGQPPSPEP